MIQNLAIQYLYKQLVNSQNMSNNEIGGRPVTITKDGTSIKVVFHPIAKAAKHPDAVVFSVKLTKSDLEKLKKAL